MAENVDPSEIFLEEDECKNIEIKNFSFTEQCQMEYDYIQPKRTYYPRLFLVQIYPNGLQEKYKDYISIQISKCSKDADPLERHAYEIITWTFSIIDINGVGRYYQSFSKENIVHFPYKIEIPDFLKRSSIIEQSKELLSTDVLTVRCEVTFLSYPGPAVEKDLILRTWKCKFSMAHDSKQNKVIESPVADYQTIINEAEKNLIDCMCYIVRAFFKIQRKHFKPEFREFWINWLVGDRTATDDLLRTYMHLNPCFQTYQLLKKKLLEVFQYQSSNIQVLELEFHKPWCEIKLELIEKLSKHNEMFDRMFSLYKIENHDKIEFEIIFHKPLCRIRHLQNLKKSNKKFDEMFPSHNFSKEIDLFNLNHNCCTSEEEMTNGEVLEIDKSQLIFNWIDELLLNNGKCNILDQNIVDDKNFNFIVEAKDGLTFTLPFKENFETIGSKLVSNSCIFKTMLKTPMREKLNKTVKLTSVESNSFINVMKYLQKIDIDNNSLPEIIKLYEVADQYELKDLLLLCANWMRPLLTPENIDDVELLAYLHCDDYLNKLIDAYISQVMGIDTLIAEFNNIHYKEKLDFYN